MKILFKSKLSIALVGSVVVKFALRKGALDDARKFKHLLTLNLV